MSYNQENDPLIDSEEGQRRSTIRAERAARPSQQNQSSVRYRTSVAALTSLDGDGLPYDDAGGGYIRDDAAGRETMRLSIIDDELQVRDDSIDLSKTKRNKLMGNILKFFIIIVTIMIYTGGPMLNSWATRIAGIQWNFSLEGDKYSAETMTGQDLINYDKTFEDVKVFQNMAHKATKCEWISNTELKKKAEEEGSKDKPDQKAVSYFRMSDLWDHHEKIEAATKAGEIPNYKRTWEAVIFPEMTGRPYAFFFKGQGKFKTSITVYKSKNFSDPVVKSDTFDFGAAIPASGLKDPTEKDFDKDENDTRTTSTPVILENFDNLDSGGNMFIQIEFEYEEYSTFDKMEIQWYFEKDIVGMSAEDTTKKLMDRGRTLEFFKSGKSSINDIIQQKGKYDGKEWVDVFGDNPGGDPYNMIWLTFLYKCFSISIAFALCFYLGWARKQEDKLIFVKACFDLKAIIKFSPCSVGWVIGDIAEMFASSGMDPAVYIVLTQLRLVLTAVVALFMLGTKQNTLQWIMLACLTLSVMVFKLDGGGGGGWPAIPLIATVVKVAISVVCGVYGEKVLKGIHQPFPVQLCNILVVSIPASACLLPALAPAFDRVDIFTYGPFGGPDFGFDYRTWIVLFFYVFREWMTNICVKRFSAVVKNICNAVAPLAAYVLQFAILQTKTFQLAKIFIIFVVILEVTNYSLAKGYISKASITAEDALPITQPKGPPSPIEEGDQEDRQSSVSQKSYSDYVGQGQDPARRMRSPK